MNDLVHKPFSGSYLAEDIDFLLQPIEIEITPITLKEVLIQSGQYHYSDMLSQEPEPTPWHLTLFEKTLATCASRVADEVIMLTKSLTQYFGDTPIILVSLVRAGVPLGVMLHRTLRKMGIRSYHYGVSIIRDRGIDTNALDWIEAQHGTKGIVFVDGWTGKGAITHELAQSLSKRVGYPSFPRLVVLADPCGCAWLSASHDDWLIPFSIMGAPISGLISRSIWRYHGFHGVVNCHHLKQYECSRYFIDFISEFIDKKISAHLPYASFKQRYSNLKIRSEKVIQYLAHHHKVATLNHIKPGIAEATRAVLRRIPEKILVKKRCDPSLALLLYLAQEKNIEVSEVGETLGQYRAVTIIKKVNND
ncbi:cysteine protease StiP domain-containing protein [Proteus myxofaciens]|uniref:Putative ATP/GTP-binding protein n=1 Tax=Proteus myxofaciens ATCC 19692 TaxID=1354337 RepID=A0A198G773_9GAMM|nr:cysteine protease StiP domain-containing protein [Proteus myxofaciens]OAT33232.1 putative ATP/GTP-binding protein [Proteus myxofaciens ATCC 19692]